MSDQKSQAEDTDPNIRDVYAKALQAMTTAFRRLEAQTEPPIRVACEDSFVYRYREQGIAQALIQKLARTISALHAIDLLLLHGFVQEQVVLQRTLDEMHEDILFLAGAVTNDEITDRHRQFLREFYDDPFLRSGPPPKKFRRTSSLPRKIIRAEMSRMLRPEDPSAVIDTVQALSTASSGFVHAASAYIMDMYAGDPPQFKLAGLLGTSRVDLQRMQAGECFYRGLIACWLVAVAFDDADLADLLTADTQHFVEAATRAGYEPARAGS